VPSVRPRKGETEMLSGPSLPYAPNGSYSDCAYSAPATNPTNLFRNGSETGLDRTLLDQAQEQTRATLTQL
jgi:hypothetical protein